MHEGGEVGSAITALDKKAGRPLSSAQCILVETAFLLLDLCYAGAIKLIRMGLSSARRCDAVLALKPSAAGGCSRITCNQNKLRRPCMVSLSECILAHSKVSPPRRYYAGAINRLKMS